MFYKKRDLEITSNLSEHYPVKYRRPNKAPVQVIVGEHEINIIAYLRFDKRLLKPYKNLIREDNPNDTDPFLVDKPEGFTYADGIVEGITKNWSGIYHFPWYKFEKDNRVPVRVTVIRKDDVLSGKCEYEVDPHQRFALVKKAPFFSPSSFVMSYPWRWLWGLPFNGSLESFALNWSPYQPGIINLNQYYSLGRYEQVAAHEFGHLLGIGDCYDAPYRFFYQMPNVNSYMMCYNRKVQDMELEMVLTAHLKRRMQYFPIKFSFKTFIKGIRDSFKD